MDVSDKVIIIVDTRHTQRWSEREINPTLCKGDLAFFCNCQRQWKTCVSGRMSALLVSHGMWMIWKVEFADVPGSITQDKHLTRCAQVCFTGTEEDQAEQRDRGTIDEVLGPQDMEGGDALEDADRDVIYLNRCLYPITQNPKNVWHPGFVFLAELALQSDGYIETCDMLRAARTPQDYTNAAKTFR